MRSSKFSLKGRVSRFVLAEGTQKAARAVNLLFLGSVLALSLKEPAHALIFNKARQSLANDLTASGWTGGASAFDLVFGLVEALLLIIPVASGIVALTRLERGAEGWMPWVSVMGGSIVFIGFVTFLTGQIFA